MPHRRCLLVTYLAGILMLQSQRIHGTESYRMKIYWDYAITKNNTYVMMVVENATSAAYCRNYCIVQPSCNSVSVLNLNTDNRRCVLITSTKWPKTLSYIPHSVTFVVDFIGKTSACEMPFVFVKYLGCLLFGYEKLPYEGAKGQCESFGGRLFIGGSNSYDRRLHNFVNTYLDRVSFSHLILGVSPISKTWDSNRQIIVEASSDPFHFCRAVDHISLLVSPKALAVDCLTPYHYVCEKIY